ncbi:hypothetical protein [Viscerimonas tarda]
MMKFACFLLLIILSPISALFCGNALDVPDADSKKERKYLPVSILSDSIQDNYTLFRYDDKRRLIEYENNASGVSRDGRFKQSVKIVIEYDKLGRIKNILRTQLFITDNEDNKRLPAKPESTKITCSYKGSILKLTNEQGAINTCLTINGKGQVVKSSSMFNKSEETSLFEYDENGNLLKTNTIYSSVEPTIFESTTVYKFDNKASITRDITVPQWFLVVYLGVSGIKNNLLEREYSDSMGTATSTSISYKYNNAGYPSSIESTENGQPQAMDIEYMEVRN